MAHHTVKSGYGQLVDRLNRHPQGAPPSEVLHGILAMLFSEREAGLVALLPIRPFTCEQAARAWSMPEVEARKVLEELAGRAILLDVEHRKGEQFFVLPPPMAGFFEFSLMRVRGDLDQKVLSELL
ncbi:MAG: (Fe-S)-binding protein, partial [Thermoanaerobaculia bacterium]